MQVEAGVLELVAGIRLLSLDVDGVMTDGRLYYGTAGEELKAFHTQDGAAVKMLMESGVQVAIITGRHSPIVERRASELGIQHVYQGAEDKARALESLSDAAGIAATEMAHAGDDVPDLALFARTGAAFAVADAHPAVIERADYVTAAAGGHGAVRELCQLLMTAQGNWPTILSRYASRYAQ